MKAPKPSEIRRIRDGLGMSQANFANAFHLNKDSVQNWEQGRSTPTGTAAVLLWLICNAPRAILKLLKGND